MGILDRFGFGKLKEGLAKTREGLVGTVARILTGAPRIDEDLLERLEETLIGADVGAGVAGEIMKGLRRRLKETPPADASGVLPLLQLEVTAQLTGSGAAATEPFALPADRPYVILVVGINGVGKTTTIGKLARRYVGAGNKVLIAAADTFRAAAGEQLEIWAQRAGADIVIQKQGADPAAVAFDAVAAATARKTDVVIIDTAGRLHTRVNLMEELKKISRVIAKQNPAAPHEVLLVLDASTGQNGLQQAKLFSAASAVTGIVLTKLDGTAKGGIVLAIAREMNLPVRYIGVGEGVDDLQPFSPADFTEALFQS